MAMLVLLLDKHADATSIDTRTAARLSELGVTNIALLRDDTTVGVVLDGWAFDPVRSADEAAAVFGNGAKKLSPVLQTVLTPSVGKETVA
ncbi:MAG: hypothetical protein M3161_02135 [Actinomycetota bacterium]|nr:hypothetical protein [Actinomycetota bacterium]